MEQGIKADFALFFGVAKSIIHLLQYDGLLDMSV